ncbi:MAG: hypothetical protein AABW59_02310 [archaeon]
MCCCTLKNKFSYLALLALFVLFISSFVFAAAPAGSDTTKPYISNYSVNTNGVEGGTVTVVPGNSFKLYYYVFNPMSTSQSGLLGASLISSSGAEISNPSGDVTKTLATYGNWYYRYFTVPTGTATGTYRLSMGLWKTPFTVRWNPNYEAGSIVTVSCGSSTYASKCYNNQLYYYDQCGNRKSLRDSCSSYNEASKCFSSSSYGYISHSRGCNSGSTSCYDNGSSVQQGTCQVYQTCTNASCVDQKPYISSATLSPTNPSLAAGSSFTINYTIVNNGSGSVTGTLGASLFKNGDNVTEYSDSSGDKTITIATGTNTYSRTFTIQPNTPGATYKISLGLWRYAFTERWSNNYDLSGYPITVNECTQGATTGTKRCSGTSAVESEYYNSNCTTYWSTSKTCYADPTTALQYCSALAFGGADCVIRLAEGSACSPAPGSTMMCASGLCVTGGTCGCVANRTQCANSATAQVCNSLGTWDSTVCASTKTCSSGACIPKASITGYSISPSAPTLTPGQSFTINYTINNVSGATITATLGASLYKNGDTVTEYSDILGDKTLTIATGSNTYSRTFTIQPNTPSGTYSLVLGLWKTPFTERWSDNYNVPGYPLTVNTTCAITSATWSKSSAAQWENVTMTVATSGCDGKTVTFDIWENDCAANTVCNYLMNDYVQQKSAVVSNGSASVQWTAAYIEDQYGIPEYFFEAKVDSQKKYSSDMYVTLPTSTATFGALDSMAKNGAITIISYDNPTGNALTQLNALKSAIETKAGRSITLYYSSQLTGSFDYEHYGNNLILFGNETNNKAIAAYKAEVAKRGLKNSEADVSMGDNPWYQGKYVILARGDGTYYDSVASLKLMVDKGANPGWAFGQFMSGCLWSGNLSNAQTITCGVLPILELAQDTRDSISCISSHPLSLVPGPIGNALAQYADESFFDIFLCQFTYVVSAYDVVGYVGAIASGGIAEGGIEAGDATLTAIKVYFKGAARGLGRKVVDDAYMTMIVAPKKFGMYVWKLGKNLPSVTESGVKSILKLLSRGETVSEKGFKLLIEEHPAVLTKMNSAEDAISATESLFKMETENGIIITIKGTDDTATTMLKMAYGDQLSTKVTNTMSTLGLTRGTISGIEIAEKVPSRTGALGRFDPSDKKIYLSSTKPLSMTEDQFRTMVINGVVPHEIGHGLTKSIILSNFTDQATEDLIVDMLLKNKLSGTELSAYIEAQKLYLASFDTMALFDEAIALGGDYDKYARATAAQLYAEAGEYGLLDTKVAIKEDVKYYLSSKFPTASGTQINKLLQDFEDYSASIKAKASSYVNTGIWLPPTEWIPTLVPETCNTSTCTISSVSWSKSSLTQNDTVTISAITSGVTDGKKLKYEISSGNSTLLTTLYANVASNTALVQWTAAYNLALASGNTVKVKVSVDENTSVNRTSSSLTVSCIAGLTGNKRCSSNKVESESRTTTCTTTWAATSDCSTLTTSPAISYSCSNNALIAASTWNTGSCDSSALTCKSTASSSSTTTQCSSTQTCNATQTKCVDNNAVITSVSWSRTPIAVGSPVYLNASTSGIANGKRIKYELYLSGAYFATLYADINNNSASAKYDVNYSSSFDSTKTMGFIAYYLDSPSVMKTSASASITCIPFTIGNKRCSFDSLQAEQVLPNCSKSWVESSNCNSLDVNSSVWAYSCDTALNKLLKTRANTDGYCDTTALTCKTRTVTDSNTIKQCAATETCNATTASCVANTCAPSICPAGYTDGGQVCVNGTCTRTCSKLGACTPASCPADYTDKNVNCLSTSCTRTCGGYNSCTPTCPSGYTAGTVSCSGTSCTLTCTKPATCGTVWNSIASKSATGSASNSSTVSKYTATVSLSGNYCYLAKYGSSYSWTKANKGKAAVVTYNYTLSDPLTKAFSFSNSGMSVGSTGSRTSPTMTTLYSPQTVSCAGYSSCKTTSGATFNVRSNAYLKINYVASSVTAKANLNVARAAFNAGVTSSASCTRATTTTTQVCTMQNTYSNQSCQVGPYIPPVTFPTIPGVTLPLIPPVTPPESDGTGESVGGISGGEGEGGPVWGVTDWGTGGPVGN